MAKVTQYECDGCGALKGATNHWWVLALAGPSSSFMTLEIYEHAIAIEPDGLEGNEVLFFCGQGCAVKRISEAMGAAESAASDSQADGAK